MKPTIRTARGPLVVLLALLAALVIAACGGSASTKTTASKNASSTSTTKSNSSSRTALAACLKKHGVTLPNGGRFRGRSGTNGGPPGGGFNGPPPGGGTAPNGAPPTSGNGGGFFGGGGGGFAGGNSKFAKAFKACGAKFGAGGFGGAGHFRGGPGRHFTPHFTASALRSYVACIRRNGDPSMPEPDTSSKAKSPFPASAEKSSKFAAANKKCESVLLKAFRSIRPPTGGGTQTPAASSTDSSA